MKWKYYKGYRYCSFYQKIFCNTKIIIQCKLPVNHWVEISELEGIGNLSEKEIDFMATNKIEEIEAYE